MSNKTELPRPTGNNILVKPIEMEMKSKGGIMLQEQLASKLSEGEVMKIGNPKYHFDCEPGEIAMYPKGVGYGLEIEGEEYIIMKESQVILFKKK